MKSGVLVEHDGKQVKQSTRRAITAAKDFGGEIIALLAGEFVASLANEVALYEGVSAVWVVDHAVYAHGLVEAFAPWLDDCVQLHGLTHIVAAGTTFGKNILPRAAALIGVSPIESVLSIQSDKHYTRSMYAGNVLCDVVSSDSIQCLTIAPTAFSPCADQADPASIEAHDFVAENTATSWVSTSQQAADKPELSTASIVMSIGRGVEGEALIERVQKLASHYGAAVGASRAVVDAGLMPNECQVGQTGQSVAPELYVAWGISGAVQHLAGMKGSRVIVSINTDPNAPMNELADYSLQADVEEVLSAWEGSFT